MKLACVLFFFFNDTATTEIYTLSLHDALPICNSRNGERLHLAAGLALPLGLTAHGDVAWANDLQTPDLASDSARRTTDVSGALRWDRHRITVEVGLARRDSFVPRGSPAGLSPLGGLGPTQATRYLTAHAAIEPLPGLHLAGWYFHPSVSSGNAFEPPNPAPISATFYSKFGRVYKSGIFALRGELAMEACSHGTAGLDTSGNVLALSGATTDRKSTRLNSSHSQISYAVFCLKKKK